MRTLPNIGVRGSGPSPKYPMTFLVLMSSAEVGGLGSMMMGCSTSLRSSTPPVSSGLISLDPSSDLSLFSLRNSSTLISGVVSSFNESSSLRQRGGSLFNDWRIFFAVSELVRFISAYSWGV
ncbi:Protein of unknown function [Cotesia congregata]|uniref:Uncharacterized protein n=1 Tax=Cotesia congregata TaxID=51543 RepID=A0A8J2HBQ9_COTCN|nr:Protein of unknown function [Cotesia congregata]